MRKRAGARSCAPRALRYGRGMLRDLTGKVARISGGATVDKNVGLLGGDAPS